MEDVVVKLLSGLYKDKIGVLIEDKILVYLGSDVKEILVSEIDFERIE